MAKVGCSISGVFLDLGISSPQFDEASRGFRPEADGPLDLRFDQSRDETAYDVLRTTSREDLAELLVRNGETDQIAARRIADAVALGVRSGSLPERTRAFANLVSEAKGHREYQAMHPAKLAFQAIRIHINQEFDELRRGMHGALRVMAKGGRLGVLTWKFSECNIVNEFYRDFEAARDDFPMMKFLREEHPSSVPAPSEFALTMDEVSRPSSREVAENSRSRSALLHVLVKRTATTVYDCEKAAYKHLGWGKPPKQQRKPTPWMRTGGSS